MEPQLFLFTLALITALAAATHIVRWRLRGRKLRALAGEWGLHYAPTDQFQLADRVAPQLPCPGAADVRVTDLIYGLKGERFRYIFTAEFTQGVVRTKHRSRRVVSMTESKDRSARDTLIPDLAVAPEELSLLDQYQSLGTKTP